MNYGNYVDEITFYIKYWNSNTCCFAGHKPCNLPWGFNEEDERCLEMKKVLKKEIIKAIEDGYINFITGMSIGFDMICAETVLELKKEYPNIKLIGALPCRHQDKMWTDDDRLRYRSIITELDKVRCIHDKYISNECMLERNRYMVNSSSLVIALYNGITGETKYTLDYAKNKGVKCVIIQTEVPQKYKKK